MASPHVTLVVDNHTFGAPESHTIRLLRHLPHWVRRSVVVSSEVAGPFLRECPDVHVVPGSRGHLWAPAIRAALGELAPDVVHVDLADQSTNLAALRAAEDAAPVVATLHGRTDARPRDAWDTYRRLACAIAPTQGLVEELSGLGALRTALIRHGVEVPDEPVPPSSRSPVVVGALGPLVTGGGVDRLLQAAATLRRRGRRFTLLVAGDGQDRAALIDRARGLPVRFTGPVADLAAFVRRLDVCCVPAPEDLAATTVDVLAFGLPCVTTAVGDTTNALAGAAAIVPPHDVPALTGSLDRLVTDAALRAKLARAARERVLRDFDIRRTAAETARLFLSTSDDWSAAG
ncbi:glycosyltransferase family 4 protein [Amycolatopsis sp. K13G38]|uniref:Glycosyltransferase family 4 protein n=1 Tax=Amycolatopsis acididurans TaxID=2724524 RepID=A0ABX1JFY9_9PSEU|nr:glycosyltransferase family 4 protein [Amycolatopsis acididurans]NKQ57421.1 glycosyltransferase family 4 protein [Amycolatopsis acididurans]